MRKTLMALMFAAALPTVAMAMPPEGGHMAGPGGPGFDGPGMHHRKGPFDKLNLTPEQRQQVGKLMGDQWHSRSEITQKYLAKLSPADQKAMQDELAAKHAKTQADIRAMLTPDQQKTFDQIQKDQAQRRADRAEFEAWKAQKAQKTQ
ncbi:LTXXQ domain protein [Pseudomonas sp. Bc-h]|jgi:protein CpxP|uniref:Spy/CpxP family protein refolding chaperone n=1 Tax=unclassified Pseudomonas TaxID=196821 RepID=UPI0009D9C2E8|nr:MULTISPECIES: Spy/CpxP family protein refolding chaperone [unclassified Pseudomonas]MDE1197341.1 Spy/CpxP family protein refolding chaperone [Pseudomonas sp.]OQR26838.1 LTXXQ domain protein [Pseudomonas sp. Bc-h]